MTKNILIVVGDIFAAMRTHLPQVVTESEIIDIIQTEQLPEGTPEGTVELLMQQGVNPDMIERAIRARMLTENCSRQVYRVTNPESMPRAVKRLAHKEKMENILVSYPERVGGEQFRLDLLFTGANEFFGDHMTGLHIQGMALTEAARQAFLVVTKAFYLKEDQRDYYFVIRDFTSRYTGFVFPFSAHLEYYVTNHTIKSGRHSFEVKMLLIQSGEACAQFDTSFTVFERAVISERENAIAQKRLESLMVKALPVSPAAPLPEMVVG